MSASTYYDKHEDIVVDLECGCHVVFFHLSKFRSSRMKSCKTHGKREQWQERTLLVERAKGLMQTFREEMKQLRKEALKDDN